MYLFYNANLLEIYNNIKLQINVTSFVNNVPSPGSFQQSFDDLSARLEPNTTDISPRHSKYGQSQYTMSVAPSPGPALQSGFDGLVLGPLQ